MMPSPASWNPDFAYAFAAVVGVVKIERILEQASVVIEIKIGSASGYVCAYNSRNRRSGEHG